MKINIKFKNLKWLMISIFLSFSLTSYALANDQKIIKTHDPNSKIIINYENLTLLYQATVTRPRTSLRKYAKKAHPGIGTKVNYSSSRPTRLEASRVFFHDIGKEEQESVHMLRLGMEALPDVIPLQTLNRNEQLAYWLNLYNITVYDELAKRYPISKLKKLYNGSRRTPSLWDEKIININGIAISLNDIQYNIIQKSWHDPLVMYGFYQGTIGGPNLRRKAFTGKRIYSQLEDNAEEFINSLRGMRFWGNEIHVSELYARNHELFPNFDRDLRLHLRQYAKFRLVTKLDSSVKIVPKFYDWHITDVLNGGHLRANSSTSTNPVSLLFSFSKAAGGSKPAGNAHFGLFDKAINTATLNNRLPEGAAVFLQDFVSNNRNDRSGKVTVEEIDKEGYKTIKVQKKPDLDKQ